jgi:hypothetical protein
MMPIHPADGRMADHAAYLGKIFAAADHHIQTDPVCSQKNRRFPRAAHCAFSGPAAG